MFRKLRLLLVILPILNACAVQPVSRSENPAEVSFRFQSEGNIAAMTFWRRAFANGELGDRFMVGVSQSTALLNLPFPDYSATVLKLDPGTYFLDSYQAAVLSKPGVVSCTSESGHYLSRSGWDEVKNTPKYMSFTVSPGEKLTLPKVRFDRDCNAEISGDTRSIIFGEKFKY